MSSAADLIDRPRPQGILGRACLAVLLTASALVLSSISGATPARAAVVESDSDITVVTANLRSPQHYTTFQEDARKVLAQNPDFVMYNEVGFRQDQFLAPDGYELWRLTTNQYTRHNAVAWKTNTWREVDHGTRRISNYPTRPPGKSTLLGLRYANWVSLESIDGRRLSVVSTHVAPRFKDRQGNWVDLLRPSVRRVGALVHELNDFGPVLVGGDFNVPYRGPRYPQDLLNEARLRPTYDLLGTSFPTGDHHGGTIDYVFARTKGRVQADWHRPVELNSDHDAVVAGFSWTTEAPEPVTVVRSQPGGSTDERRAVGRLLRERIAATRAGETLQVGTRGLSLPLAYRALRRAEARGVRVQVTTLSVDLTWRERRLRQSLDANGSWLRRCQDDCRTRWLQNEPPSLLLVSDAQGDGKVRIDVTRRLSEAVVTRRTTARVSTSSWALDDARAAFAG